MSDDRAVRMPIVGMVVERACYSESDAGSRYVEIVFDNGQRLLVREHGGYVRWTLDTPVSE